MKEMIRQQFARFIQEFRKPKLAMVPIVERASGYRSLKLSGIDDYHKFKDAMIP